MAVHSIVFGTLPDGREARLYTLENPSGMTLAVTDYGCRIVRLLTPDRNGDLGDVVQGHRTLEEYFGSNYQGAFVGRYANRIGGARFTLNGETYPLAKNDGKNTLHGGPGGYHGVLFEAQVCDGDEPSITFTHVSPDGDEGYPGTLKIQVTYTLTADNALRLEYRGATDKTTVFNPTNHAFFNLSGNFQQDVLDTELSISAAHVTEVTEDLIPTGRLLPVAGGPVDFTRPKKLGQDMFAQDPLIAHCGGFDNNFCVDGEGFRKMAEAYEPVSGRMMEVYSDMPGIQLYTFNSVEGLLDKNGRPMRPHTAFCLETQFYPDSPNQPQFPFKPLEPGEEFRSETVYRFSVR